MDPGYEITLVASEEMFPDLAKPVVMNFDSKGRMWVSTMPSYPQWKSKTKLDDEILILKAWLSKVPATDSDSIHLRLEGLWLYQTHNVVEETLLRELLRCSEPRAQAAATRALCYWRDQIPDVNSLIKTQLNDENGRVRIEAVRACSYLKAAGMQEAVLNVLNYELDDPKFVPVHSAIAARLGISLADRTHAVESHRNSGSQYRPLANRFRYPMEER